MSSPALITRRELAGALGCHPQTVNRWASEGMPVATPGRGGRASRYDEAACRAWMDTRRTAAEGEPVDLVRERARKERAQARLAEQQYAQRAGELLPRGEVEQVWAREIAAVRTKILAIETTHADRVHRAASEAGVTGVERALHTLAREVLQELAGGEALAASTATRRPPRKKTKATKARRRR